MKDNIEQMAEEILQAAENKFPIIPENLIERGIDYPAYFNRQHESRLAFMEGAEWQLQIAAKEEGEAEEIRKKAEKWDKLGAEIEKCYVVPDPNEEGEYIENEDQDIDLGTIGELAATAYGWL